MEAGRLRHIVEIQNYTLAQDSAGDEVKTYGSGSSAFATVRAEIKTLRGRELYAAQQDYAEAEVRITCRYVSGVTEKMRVAHDGVYFDILNVDDVDRRHIQLVLLCKAGVADTR